jgi:DNA gyrase subunit A
MTNTININLAQQVQDDYLAYSLSVIVGRAFPRYTDGCKTISRRIMTAMRWLNLKPEGGYMKSARVEGEVMGKLSPHGGSYSSIVTLAASWNNMVPLVDGHGNWGSSTDQSASSRYTGCKLSPFAWDCLLDDSDTWETTPNYDGSLQEPVELNVKIPYVLLNGQEGIGVGYACKIASHNLRSIIEATKLVCKDAVTEKAYAENLRKARKILLPDFPTGTQIVQDEQLDAYTRTGIGGIRCVACVESGIQKRGGKSRDRSTLTFTCLPPGTNPEKLGEQIKSELEKGRIEGIAEITDESDISGDRLVVVTKSGSDINLVKQLLYTYTDLDCKYSAKTLVIDGFKPVELSPVQIIQRWVQWRLGRLDVKFEHELEAKNKRLHIVGGLLKAIDRMDLVIKRIRAANGKSEAKQSLMSAPLKFTEQQADAILEMRLRQLTCLDFDLMSCEKNELLADINRLESLVGDKADNVSARKSYMLEELARINKQYGVPRRSPLIDVPVAVGVRPKVDNAGSPPPTTTPSGTTPIAKPRFLKIDMKKGVVEQSKGPKGCLAMGSTDKLIIMCEDGMLKKVPASYKGVISNGYSPVVLARPESYVSGRKYLAVFMVGGQLRAMALDGETLCRTTSTGKQWLPEGATLTYFGENPFTVEWVSTKKKPTKIDLSVKLGKPGAKGAKIANLNEIKLP